MRSDQPMPSAPTHGARLPAAPCFVDWFPRAFGLMLAVLARTFILALLRAEPSPRPPAHPAEEDRILRSCLRCEDRGLLGAWSRLFQR